MNGKKTEIGYNRWGTTVPSEPIVDPLSEAKRSKETLADGEYPINGRQLGVEKPLGERRVNFPALLVTRIDFLT